MTLNDAILLFEDYPNPTIFLYRVLEVLREVASGTEAGTGETEGLDPKGDGQVGATGAETPIPGPIAPVQDDKS